MTSILQLDIAGNPSAWISHRDAISMTACDRIIANLGNNEFVFRGGVSRLSGSQSTLTVGSILLTKQRVMSNRLAKDYSPPLTNKGLFARDGNMCLYCGKTFSTRQLTRDHIMPKSRRYDESWMNSATACVRCNNKKGNQTPEEWGHLLLAVPFTPSWAEYLYLKNSRHIISDQQVFLKMRFPKGSRLL